MATVDPVSKALLDLYNVHADRRQAELDLDRAKAKEAMAGRTAVPGVMAELASQHQKEQKRREAIQKAGEGQQLTPVQAAPPLIDVSGQTSGRSGLGGSIAGEIFNQVSGGSGIKQGVIGWGMGNQLPPQNAPTNTGATSQNGPQGAAPGSVIPIKEQLGWPERIVGGLMGVAARQPSAVVQAVTGERTIDYQQMPTIDQQAGILAQPLSVLRARMESQDPAIAQAAQQQYQQHLDQIQKDLGDDMKNRAQSTAEDLFLTADEKRRQKEEDPLYQLKRAREQTKFDITNKALTHGVGSLTPEERTIFEGQRQKIDVNATFTQLTPTNRTKFQAETADADTLINQMNTLDTAMSNPDGTPWTEPFTYQGKLDYWNLQQRDKAGALHPQGPLNDIERKRLDRYATVEQNMAMLNVPYMHKLIGATMSPAELERIDGLLAQFNKSPTQNASTLRELRENVGLSKLRYITILNTPEFQGMDPAAAMPMSNAKELARQQADAMAQRLIQSGASPELAAEQVRTAFRNAYGLDIDRILGTSNAR